MSLSIAEFQQWIREAFGAKDARRGASGTFMWFMEEVGELAGALRAGSAANQTEEFADVLAWLATLANTAGIDLEKAVRQIRAGLPRLSSGAMPLRSDGETVSHQRCGNLMRTMLAAVMLLPLLAWDVSPALGQAPPKVTFESIQVGFSALSDPGEPMMEYRGRPGLHKAGFWTPVYVTITPGPEGISGDPSNRIVVESTDTDDVQNNYSIPLPRGGLPPNESIGFLTYTKPGSAGGELLITVYADGKIFDYKQAFDAVGPGDFLYLTIGSRLPGLRRTLADSSNQTASLNSTRSTYVDKDIRALPNQWFGYSSIDLMFLTTGNRDFISGLINERENRKEAIADWVRRGGHLVISFGRNQDMMTELLAQLQFDLPVAVTGPLLVPHLEAIQGWLPPGQPKFANPIDKKKPNAAPAHIEIGKIERKPARDVELIVPPRETDNSPLLIVRAPVGLGQVTLVAFDLDIGTLTKYPGQTEFWKRLQDKLRAKPLSGDRVNSRQIPGMGMGYESNDLASQLERNLENFQDIPVISFGWVALFILIYIVIVGPLDYLFLKKVVKRLEFTWITFPTVVLAVSVGAYFAAYSLKGNDLKINKIDLVDIDLASQRAYGTTWFTLFSPRIQLYTIGVEPGFGEEKTGEDKKPIGTVVSWLGRPENGYGGYGRARSQSLFRRSYDYDANAAGLRGVPIQVWSTKSFTASWEQPFTHFPPVVADLRHRDNAPGLEGSITHNLPVALESAFLIYSEKENLGASRVMDLGTLSPGTPKRLTPTPQTPPGLSQWVTGAVLDSPNTVNIVQNLPTSELVKRMMFYDASSQENTANSALRGLDQSWRQGHGNEAILVGHIPREEGPTEAMTQNPKMPSRLWLGRLPEGTNKRPDLAGTLSQDTYVRVFLPVAPAPGRGKPKVSK